MHRNHTTKKMYYHTYCIILLAILASQVSSEENQTVVQKDTQDSYLEAYKDVKSLNGNIKVISNREYNVGNGPYPGPINGADNNYGPDFNYGPPRPAYGPPAK